MRVSVSAKVLNMPEACACCGGAADRTFRATAVRVEGKRVIRTRTAAWTFPQCAGCARHDDLWPDATAGVVFWLTLLTCGIYLYFYLDRRKRARALCLPACAPPRQAVQYFGWHGTVHHFDFHSPVFTRDFVIANGKKVVEVDPSVTALIQHATRPLPVTVPEVRTPSVPVRAPAAPSPPPRPPAAPAAARPVAAYVPAPPVVAHVPAAPVAAYAPPPAPPRPRADAGPRFVGLRDRVDVAGRVLMGPMVYVSSDPRTEDASTIVTVAPVGRTSLATPLPYWPSYAGATPDQRAKYLDWLMKEREDRSIEVGYPFLYFYGLERRMLVDRRDHVEVRAELKRLLGIYGENRSFQGYASRLLAFMILSRLAETDEAEIHAELAPLASHDATALGALLAWFHLRDRPLPAEYAASCVRTMDGAKGGVVVQRAAKELADLFAIRYRESFKDGLLLQAAKRAETVAYHPASASLAISMRGLGVAVPHVLGRPAQFNPVVEVWNGCIDDLRKVSSARRSGTGSRAMSAEAWMALPPELRAETEHPAQDAWDELIGRAPRVESYHLVQARQLAALMGASAANGVTGKAMREACETAALLGYAVEPDGRVETRKRAGDAEVLVWRADDTRPMDAALWRSAYTMLALMLSVAHSDGAVASAETAIVASLVEELFVLDDLMRRRVEAMRHLLTREPAKVTAIARALRTTRTADELRKVGRVLVAVAGADRSITDAEHKSLRNLYKALGLTSGDLAAAIATSGARLESDEPVSMRPAEAGPAGEAIPRPARPSAPKLDGNAIAAILAETREVAAMLAAVLDDDDDEQESPRAVSISPAPAAPVSVAPPVPTGGVFETLDIRYQAVAGQLLTKDIWSLTEVRALASGARLMPGAILETLNTWSDERFGEYLIEETEGWRVRLDLLRRDNA
jgi:uncharacterized tellurite resistance protein B-like protein